MVEGRDAIYKEFLFKDFNEVIVLFFTTIISYVVETVRSSTSSSSVLGTIMTSWGFLLDSVCNVFFSIIRC